MTGGFCCSRYDDAGECHREGGAGGVRGYMCGVVDDAENSHTTMRSTGTVRGCSARAFIVGHVVAGGAARPIGHGLLIVMGE